MHADSENWRHYFLLSTNLKHGSQGLNCYSHIIFNPVLKFTVCLFYMSEKREAEAARIRMQYPDRRPVWFFFAVVCSFYSRFLFYFVLKFVVFCRWLWKGLKRVMCLRLQRTSNYTYLSHIHFDIAFFFASVYDILDVGSVMLLSSSLYN